MSCDHNFSELTVDCFENLCFFRELLSDIITADEDVNQDSPVLLDLEPLIYDNINSTEFLFAML